MHNISCHRQMYQSHVQEKPWPLPSSLIVRIENKYPAQILTGTLPHAAAVRRPPALLLPRNAVEVQDLAHVLGNRDAPGWDPLTRNDMTEDNSGCLPFSERKENHRERAQRPRFPDSKDLFQHFLERILTTLD